MEDLLFSVNAVVPVFLMIGTGYLLSRMGVFTEPFLECANRISFTVLLPVLICYNIYTSDFRTAFDLNTILFAVGGISAAFFLLWLIVPRFVKDNARRGVMIQGMFRCNYALMGLPIAENLAGKEGAEMTAVAVAFVIPVLNVLSTIVLAHYSFAGKPDVRKVAKKVLLNPLIIASMLGILMALTGFMPPQAVTKAAASLGGTATPLALLVLGASFRFGEVKKNLLYIVFGSLTKTVFIPVVFLGLAILLGFSGIPYITLLTAFASPVAVSSYVMAVREKADGELAGQLIVITTAMSMITIFLFIYASRLMGIL